jgi:hypothetical protein
MAVREYGREITEMTTLWSFDKVVIMPFDKRESQEMSPLNVHAMQ